MHNVKYVVENMNFTGDYAGSSFLPEFNASPFYTQRYTRARFTVFENKYNLPIAFWVSNDLRGWNYSDTNPFVVQDDFWSRASGGSAVFETLQPQIAYDFDVENTVSADFNGDYVSYTNKPENKTARIKCTLSTETAQNCYIYADTPAVEAITIVRDSGSETPLYQTRSHDTRAVWDVGMVRPGDPLRFELTLSATAGTNGGFNFYAVGVEMDAFLQGYEALAAGALTDVKTPDERTITGRVNAPEAGMLFTSIPNDPGWKVRVDGKDLPEDKYESIGNGAFLIVRLTRGVHEIELRFEPQGLSLGLALSGIGLLLLLTVILLTFLRRKAAEKPGAHAAPVTSVATNASEEVPAHTEAPLPGSAAKLYMPPDLPENEPLWPAPGAFAPAETESAASTRAHRTETGRTEKEEIPENTDALPAESAWLPTFRLTDTDERDAPSA
jgi:hypothetical protein